jgi:hypothetical protein
MHKLTGWIFLIIGLILLLPLIGLTFLQPQKIDQWLIMLAVLLIGIVKITAK